MTQEKIKKAALLRDAEGDFDSNDGRAGFIEGAEWANEQFIKFLEDEMNSLREGQLPHYTIERLIKRWKNQNL